ncbi:MAG: hypothetical protein LBL31_00255 [Spirochaetaceae bacterium]|nr:hypothetical protein [Spirochaetaceae bacterium]
MDLGPCGREGGAGEPAGACFPAGCPAVLSKGRRFVPPAGSRPPLALSCAYVPQDGPVDNSAVIHARMGGTRRIGMRKTAKTAAAAVLLAALALCSCATPGPRGEDGFPTARQYDREDINGVFPDAVYIKTRTQTFNAYHYYILYQGLIWYKSIDPRGTATRSTDGTGSIDSTDGTGSIDGIEGNGNAGGGGKGPRNWELFQKTGLPRNFWRFGFNKPRRIVEIAADADELVALSDEGGFYRYCFDITIAHKSNEWLDRQGWPVSEQLFLDRRTARNAAWALGKRNSHVLYYEDPFGNQHHNGTMEIATTYMLLEGGQEISYADTGLRSDFSRNFIGPERGAFKAVALSASASTMFVINGAGEMYTRIADFDITGCDPMFFKYTYTPYVSDLPGTNYFSNLSEWGLPSEDWRGQPGIPLDGKAAITRHITILQTGQGNGARELRVAGLDEEGNRGYWNKGIFDETWRFTVAPLYFPSGSLLENSAGERGKTLDAAFSGFRWTGGERDDDALYEIPDFNILEGDCALRVTSGEETFALTLHPVELWTYLKRDFMPGRTGLPKMFMVTVSFDEGGLDAAGLSDRFAAFIRERFGRHNRKLFQYSMAAGAPFCLLRDNDDPDSVIFLTDGSLSDNFPEFNAAWYLLYADEIARYHSPELMIENTASAPDAAADADAAVPPPLPMREKIALNKILRDRIRAELRVLKDDKALAAGMNIGYFHLDTIVRYSPLRFVNVPKFRTLIGFGKEIILQNNAYIDRFVESLAWVHQKNIGLLDLRIAAYTDLAERAERAEKEDGPVSLPPWFSEQVTGYWDIAGLPRAVRGTFFSSAGRAAPGEEETPPVTLAFVPPQDEQSVFGWYLAAGPSYTLFIDPQDSLETVYRRKGKTPGERALTLDCVIYAHSSGKRGVEEASVAQYLESFAGENRNGIKARVTFDGETFEIREYPALHNNRVIFRGKPAIALDQEQ